MNNFEFFSLIFLMLDSCWDDCKDSKLGNFLSDWNDAMQQFMKQEHKGSVK